jgi:hypothetical protein
VDMQRVSTLDYMRTCAHVYITRAVAKVWNHEQYKCVKRTCVLHGKQQNSSAHGKVLGGTSDTTFLFKCFNLYGSASMSYKLIILVPYLVTY